MATRHRLTSDAGRDARLDPRPDRYDTLCAHRISAPLRASVSRNLYLLFLMLRPKNAATLCRFYPVKPRDVEEPLLPIKQVLKNALKPDISARQRNTAQHSTAQLQAAHHKSEHGAKGK